MPAPKLRHDKEIAGTANTATPVLPAVIAAARALVVSKLTVSPQINASMTFSIQITSNGNFTSTFIARDVPLAFGETYTESGLVVAAGETVFVYCSVANGVSVNVFGEEVDN